MVTCPWHGWKYSVIDGKAPHEGGDSVRSYETKVIGDWIYLGKFSSLISFLLVSNIKNKRIHHF